jgi:hypothetical protein
VIKKPQRRRPRPDLGCSAILWMEVRKKYVHQLNFKSDLFEFIPMEGGMMFMKLFKGRGSVNYKRLGISAVERIKKI